MFVRGFVAAALLIGCNPLLAQELPSEAIVRPMTSGGAIVGCSIEYTALFRDHAYRGGAPGGVTGSLSWMRHPGQGLALLLKVVGADVSLTPGVPPNRYPIFAASLALNGQQYIPDQRFDCEEQIGYCGALDFRKATVTLMAFMEGSATAGFSFNRTAGGLDLSVPLPRLTQGQNLQLSQCSMTLLNEIQSQLPSTPKQ